MSDADALMAAILDRSAEDTPRLVYADWLDDHGEEGRAEFIRVQVELARMPKRHVITERVALTNRGPDYWECPSGAIADTGILVMAANPGDRVDILARKNPLLGLRVVKFLHDPRERDWRGDAILARDEHSGPDTSGELRRREDELFRGDGIGGQFLDTLPAIALSKQAACDQHQDYGAPFRFLFRRGFLAEVRCPLSAWVGGQCLQCRGDGYTEGRYRWDADGTRTDRCPSCSGSMTGPGVGPAVVRGQPVTRVTIVGAEPHPSSFVNAYVWFDDADGSVVEPEAVPGEIFDLLPGHPVPLSRPPRAHKGYPDRAAALDALSAALIRWAKSEAAKPSCLVTTSATPRDL